MFYIKNLYKNEIIFPLFPVLSQEAIKFENIPNSTTEDNFYKQYFGLLSMKM